MKRHYLRKVAFHRSLVSVFTTPHCYFKPSCLTGIIRGLGFNAAPQAGQATRKPSYA
jgi:putative component of membrane protein insertase Oxa1/YidC/SpoIIIJ protein YidD